MFLPNWYSRFGALLLGESKLASPVRVAFRRRPVGADGEGVVVPECVELFAGLDEEAEGVDAVETFEDEEVDFGWEGEERWHGLGTEIFWTWWFGIGRYCRAAGIDDELLDWGCFDVIGRVGGCQGWVT